MQRYIKNLIYQRRRLFFREILLWLIHVNFDCLCKMCFCQTFAMRSSYIKHSCKGKPLDPISEVSKSLNWLYSLLSNYKSLLIINVIRVFIWSSPPARRGYAVEG